MIGRCCRPRAAAARVAVRSLLSATCRRDQLADPTGIYAGTLLALAVWPCSFAARIASRLGGRIQLIDLDRITHFIAEDKLTYAVTAERSYVVDPSIADLEERYAAAGFFRIHRATLVRLSAIVELASTADGTRVRLGDSKTELPLARERARALKDKLGL